MGKVSSLAQIHPQDGVSRLEHGEVDGHVGLGSGVGLHVGVVRFEELPGAFLGQSFRHIHVFAASVISPSRITFSVLVGEHGSLGLEDCAADKVFRCDELEFSLLPLFLLADDLGDFRIGGLQIGHVLSLSSS